MRKYTRIAAFLLSAILLGGCGDGGNTQEKNAKAPAENSSEASQETPAEDSSEASQETPAEDSSEASQKAEGKAAQGALADGTYLADFDTDSGMFHVSEACDGKGTLTVEKGEMTIHISLTSKNIVGLYPGLAKDAAKDGAKTLSPTEDTVTYSDGMTEEVYGFDVPVPELDTEFDLALIGTKGKWYDHKVSVSNPVPAEEDGQAKNTSNSEDSAQAGNTNALKDSAQAKTADTLENGTYSVEITFEGGSGKAEILSPVTVTVAEGTAMAALKWSSPNYDYMIVDGEKYLPVNTEGSSEFEFPVPVFDTPIDVIGDTIAMSRPHEVEYTLTFHSSTMKKE